MAKSKSFIGQHTALTVVIIIVVAFIAGFILARAKYKPQIRESFDMVMEREGRIAELESKLKDYENAVMKTTDN